MLSHGVKAWKKQTLSGCCWTIAAVTAVIYSICRVPYILNEEAQRWCSNKHNDQMQLVL